MCDADVRCGSFLSVPRPHGSPQHLVSQVKYQKELALSGMYRDVGSCFISVCQRNVQAIFWYIFSFQKTSMGMTKISGDLYDRSKVKEVKNGINR